MDRSLDDTINDRNRAPRGPRAGRNNYYNDQPRDSRKPREAPRDLDRDWVHDRYQDDEYSRPARDNRAPRDRRIDRYEPDSATRSTESGSKIKVENLHYDLTQKDLTELFERIGPVDTVQILYDRQDRSRGIAFVTYRDSRDASRAVREYDGANAYGQPISLALLPSGPAGGRSGGGRGLDERITAPERSLFDRIEGGRGGRGPSRRSESPQRTRRSDVTRPAPDNIDRYVPGGARDDSRRRDRDRSRSPLRRDGRGPRGGRRDGRDSRDTRDARNGRGGRDDRRGGGGRGPRLDADGRPVVGGRPRKTADELDAEMADYWGAAGEDDVQRDEVAGGVAAGAGGVAADSTGADITGAAAAQQGGDMDDIDMIE